MNVVFGNAFRMRLELRRESRAPRPFVLEVIHFLEVNQDRHVELGGQRIGAPELRAVGGERDTSSRRIPARRP